MSRLNALIAAAAAGLSVLAVVWNGQCAMADIGADLLAQAQPAQPQQSVEANISELHQKLQITPAQEAQFSAVATIMRENARAEASAQQAPPPNATAVEVVRAEIRYAEVELAGMRKFLPALDALYAILSPAQKKTADALFRQGPGG
jgi:periplasmic protein CpxP/Spy